MDPNMHISIDGVVPVMLAPFTASDQIDEGGLERLVEWYVSYGAQTLFAVCQSSEMQKLSLDERVLLARRTLEFSVGRLPVIASGHNISASLDDQIAELSAMARLAWARWCWSLTVSTPTIAVSRRFARRWTQS